MKQDSEIPRTVVINFRGDVRDLATLLGCFNSLGIPVHSKGGVVRLGVAMAASLLSEKCGIKPLESTAAAMDYLKRHNFLYCDRGAMNRARQLLMESGRLEPPIVESTTEIEQAVAELVDPSVE